MENLKVPSGSFQMRFLKYTVNGEKFERLVWTICSARNAHVLGVKELNTGQIILDMSESLEVCRY